MIASVLAAALVALSPAPLRTIVHERSSPFCTTLRENVGHALTGLLANDDAIARSKPLYVKLAHDYAAWSPDGRNDGRRSPATHLDMQRMEIIVGAIVHNLQVIDALLTDPVRFTPSAASQDDRTLSSIRAQLNGVEDAQRKSLNVLNGTVETYAFEDLQGRGNGLGGALGKDAGGEGSDDFFSCRPIKSLECSGDPALKSDPLFLNSPFARFYGAIARSQADTTALESPASQTILANLGSCR